MSAAVNCSEVNEKSFPAEVFAYSKRTAEASLASILPSPVTSPYSYFVSVGVTDTVVVADVVETVDVVDKAVSVAEIDSVAVVVKDVVVEVVVDVVVMRQKH